MKVVLLNTTEMEGGAGRAAHRLHQGFLKIGLDSCMLVQQRSTHDRRVIAPDSKLGRGLNALRPTLDQLPQRVFAPNAMTGFSTLWFPDGVRKVLFDHEPDIVHLHYLAKGFMQIETLAKIGLPLVWTMHDEWAYTGGCFYTGGCERYQASCGACPKLGSKGEKDLSRWVWRRKQKAWRNLQITFVCPSRWLADRAARSTLFAGQKIQVIANGIDLEQFKPLDRRVARQWLNLPQEKKLVLFSAMRGAHNPYKGFHFLPELLQHLADLGWQDQMELLILGDGEVEDLPGAALPVRWMGHFQDEVTIALLNAAVDVQVAPSLQDNLPNTVMEALACGTPCAAFRVGGISEMIDHQENGYLAAPGEVRDLADGVHWILENSERYQNLSSQARLTARKRFDLVQQASKYGDLIAGILSREEHA